MHPTFWIMEEGLNFWLLDELYECLLCVLSGMRVRTVGEE